MRLFFSLLFPSLLLAIPIQVPNQLYSGWGKNDHHPGNAPLISDITFRSICDHVIDQGTEWFEPNRVKLGDTIYINLWYIQWFHTNVHDEIKNPYILVSCDVGDWHPDPVVQNLFYDPKLAAWFCRNILFSHHPKIFQLPMGQTDRYFGYGWLPLLQQLTELKPFEKKYFLYMNYLPRDFGDRHKIVKLFEHEPYCFSRNHSGQIYSSISKEDYYRELAASTFVVSPIGLETDCVRTWEALSLDCIPIIEHSFLDPLFNDLPVLFTHDWKEINEGYLREQLESLHNKKSDKAFFSYWEKQIREMQAKVRKKDLTSSYLEATLWPQEELAQFVEILEKEDCPCLLYKGFLTSLHSLQVAEASPFLSHIFLRDPFLYQESLENFSSPKEREKIELVSEKEFYAEIGNPFSFQHSPIFLDLTYQRSSLLRDFQDFRHSLKKDLKEIYYKMNSEVLLFGNGLKDPYVREVLDQLSKECEIDIGQKGNFWFLRKN